MSKLYEVFGAEDFHGLIGYTVQKVEDLEMESDEYKETGVLISFMNENAIRIDAFFSDKGMSVSSHYCKDVGELT